jgi:hypothetical protein
MTASRYEKHRKEQEQEDRDKFAIEFHRWMRVNDTKENADKYFHYTDKDMLNAFKKYYDRHCKKLY